MISFFKIGTYLVSISVIAGCGMETNAPVNTSDSAPTLEVQNSIPPSNNRWYTAEQAKMGRLVYQNNCQNCHGKHGSGSTNWRKKLPDGSWPPPPLNGTAHTWHHDLNFLYSKIKNGASNSNERMPAFGNVLTDSQIKTVIAYFQSYWTDEIYEAWKDWDH